MIYILLENDPSESLTLKGETFKYLIKSRRHNTGDKINFRSKKDMSVLYTYEIITIDSRSLELKYISSNPHAVSAKKSLHIGWCMIDNKSIEKVLPSLSEIGVEKISFISCDRSQKNFKLDFKRFERILEASMQQCGRSNYMEFDTYKNIKEFIKKFPHAKVLDFTDKILDEYESIDTVIVGCEGGFSHAEKEFLSECDVFKLPTQMVLRSESAVMAISSNILL